MAPADLTHRLHLSRLSIHARSTSVLRLRRVAVQLFRVQPCHSISLTCYNAHCRARQAGACGSSFAQGIL